MILNKYCTEWVIGVLLFFSPKTVCPLLLCGRAQGKFDFAKKRYEHLELNKKQSTCLILNFATSTAAAMRLRTVLLSLQSHVHPWGTESNRFKCWHRGSMCWEVRSDDHSVLGKWKKKKQSNFDEFKHIKLHNIGLWTEVQKSYPWVYIGVNKWLNKLINWEKRDKILCRTILNGRGYGVCLDVPS